MESARHVTGCRLTQETRGQNAFDDVASIIHQSIAAGAVGAVGGGGGGGGGSGWCQAHGARQGRAVQVELMKPVLNTPNFNTMHPP